jgi:hypothetical protein
MLVRLILGGSVVWILWRWAEPRYTETVRTVRLAERLVGQFAGDGESLSTTELVDSLPPPELHRAINDSLESLLNGMDGVRGLL